MKKGLPLAVLAVVALVAGAWAILRLPEAPSDADPETAAQALERQQRAPSPDREKLAASAVLKIDPRTHSGVAAMPQPRATLFNEFLAARQYRPIYERLRGSAEGETPEGRLILWELLRQCANVTEGRRPGVRPTPPKREAFLASLAESDPQRDKRIAAFEAFTVDKCAGLEGVTITMAELNKLLADSAAGGDPRARALSIEQQLWQSRRASGRDGVTLSDVQIEELKQVVSTKDPEAMRVAGRVLANPWSDYALRIGPEQQPVEPRAFMNAWLVLSCEYGAPCGADTPRMLQACAMQGHCDAETFPDYLYYYGSTPHDSQLLVQYRVTLRDAIETGNWSQFNVVRGLPPAINRMMFVPGPR